MFSDLSAKTKLFVIGGVILLFAIILWLVWRAGKNKSTTTVNLSSGNSDAGGALASEAEIKQLAEKVHNDLDGLNFFGHSNEVWSQVLALSDTDLTRLYNQFNMVYQDKDSGGLVKWVSNDPAIIGSQWSVTKDALLTRFAKLNFV